MQQKRIGDLRISNRQTMRMLLDSGGNTPVIPSEESLFAFAEKLSFRGALSGTGQIRSSGQSTQSIGGITGGAGGGGSVTVMFGSNPSGQVTVVASGGSTRGGGAGTGRKLTIPA